MGRLGVTNRPGDGSFRRFDQLVHEFGHAIDMNLRLDSGRIMGVEKFAYVVQSWFNANGDQVNGRANQRTYEPSNYGFLRDNVFLENREWNAPFIYRRGGR